jgi:hypothetical protein
METRSDDFNELRKLLALKRHEQPFPRYFNEFSGRVIDRLRTPELLPEPTWWERLGFAFDLRPALVCVMGVMVSSLFFFGAMTAVPTEAPVTAGVQPIGMAEVGDIVGMPSMLASVTQRGNLDDFQTSSSAVFVSAAASSPFGQVGAPASRANWTFGRVQN